MFKTPTKMKAPTEGCLAEMSPNLMAAILDSSITKVQLRPNKLFVTSKAPSREELAEAVLFTAALRHCENEDRQGLDALKMLLIADAQERIAADKRCTLEWNTLVKFTLGQLTEATGFEGKYSSLIAAILDSGMTAKQMQSRVNKEFLEKKGGSPTKAEFAEALIRTAAKRHGDSDAGPKDMEALRKLVIKSAQDNLDSDCSCAREWHQFVSEGSPDDVSSIGKVIFTLDETTKQLDFRTDIEGDFSCDTEEEEEDPSAWPHTGMKVTELKEMAEERGVDVEAITADKRKRIVWVQVIVETLSIDELKEMASAREVPDPAEDKRAKSTWVSAIMDAMA